VKTLFGKAIDNAAKSELLEERLANLIDTVTKMIYTNIARGLFEADKLIYSLLIAISIRRKAGIIGMISWNHLLRGPMPFSPAQVDCMPENPMPNCMTALAYSLFYSMELFEGDTFYGLCESVNENKEAWTEWATCENPHTTDIPCGW
jgi:dynein heavy chain